MKATHLNRKMRSSNLQQNKTKTGNSRISLKLPQRFIRTQKHILKEKKWSKTMLLWASQPRRRVVLRQRRDTEVNWRVIVLLPTMRLPSSVALVQGEEVGEANETAVGNQKKEALPDIPPTPVENQRKGKSLKKQREVLAHTRCTKGNGNAEGGTKKKKAWEDSNPVIKRDSRYV